MIGKGKSKPRDEGGDTQIWLNFEQWIYNLFGGLRDNRISRPHIWKNKIIINKMMKISHPQFTKKIEKQNFGHRSRKTTTRKTIETRRDVWAWFTNTV